MINSNLKSKFIRLRKHLLAALEKNKKKETIQSNNSPEINAKNTFEDKVFGKWNNWKASLGNSQRGFIEATEFILTLLLLLIIIRQGIFERRYIPSESMLPNLQIGDQLIIEKVSKNLFGSKAYKRGDIIVFYPPKEANNGQDLKQDFPNGFVRLTGLSSDIQVGAITLFPFLPKAEDAYIKRIVGLPGDKIEIKSKDGVYINGQKLTETYVFEKPFYDSINNLKDLYASSVACGTTLDSKFENNTNPIIIPPDHYLCLGDNRNNSKDGHCWGFVKRDRIIGKAHSVIWRDLGLKPDLRSPYSELF